jgi:hypothetical protein
MPQVWHQHAGTASRSGTSSVLPSTSWTWQWSLGPDSAGAVAGGWTGTTPAQAFPVCGNGRIYRPLGSSGLNARTLSSGTSSWTNTDATFNGPAAYDHRTDCVLAGGSNGTLYRIDASTGTTTASVSCGSAITKAVAIRGDYAYVVCADGGARKVRVSTMAVAWTYTGGSSSGQAAQSHPAVGLSGGLVKLIYATADGYVHAVDDLTGAASWRIKPYTSTWTSDHSFDGSWPVIAPKTGVVLIRCQLPQISGGGALTAGPSAGNFPSTGAAAAASTIRTWFGTRGSPGTGAAYASLFAIAWSDGSESFVPAVGHCSTEDFVSSNAYGVMGMQPVVKSFTNGDEVVYIQFRNHAAATASSGDTRWSGVMGEMVLDSSTVSGLAPGDLRFVEMGSPFSGDSGYMRIVDESCPITVAGGDTPVILHAHWAGAEAAQIADRSDSLGLTYASPIDTTELPVVIRANGTGGTFTSGTHATTSGTALTGRFYGNTTKYAQFRITAADPPGGKNTDTATTSSGTYSAGLLPRYTFVHNQYLVVVGNGGDLYVATHSGTVGTAPAVSSVADNRATYTSSQPHVGEKVTVTCDVTTAAPKLGLPYDEDFESEGVTVDALFSSDNFATYEAVPVVRRGVFTKQTLSGKRHITMTGTTWKANWSPRSAGSWAYKIAVLDKNGTAVTSASTAITVLALNSKGFLAISSADHRRLQTTDGNYLVAQGYNDEHGQPMFLGDYPNVSAPVTRQTATMDDWQTNGLSFHRLWLRRLGAYGAGSDGRWHTRADANDFQLVIPGDSGWTPKTGFDAAWRLDTKLTYSGEDSSVLNKRAVVQCQWPDPSFYYKANVVYKLTFEYQIPNALDVDTGANPYGLMAKVGDFINWWQTGTGTGATNSASGVGGTVQRITAANAGTWNTYTGYWKAPSSDGITGIGITLENVLTTGTNNVAYIVNVKAIPTNGTDGTATGPDVLGELGNFDMHARMDLCRAELIEELLDNASARDLYFILTLFWQGDRIVNRIKSDGTWDSTIPGDGVNWHGTGATRTKTRYYQEGLLRQIIGSFAYSRAYGMHELHNEQGQGTTTTDSVYAQVGELGLFVKQYGNQKPWGTSFSESIHPITLFYNGPYSSVIDYMEPHQYARSNWPTSAPGSSVQISTATFSNVLLKEQWTDSALIVRRMGESFGANATTYAVDKPYILGETDLTGTSSGDPSDRSADTNDIWLHRLVWSQSDFGGVIPLLWYVQDNVYDSWDASPNKLAFFKRFYDFIKTEPLHNGHYADIGATPPHTDLYVWGAKDNTNNRLHGWVAHKDAHWQQAVTGTPTVTARSGSITIPVTANGTWDVQWFATRTSGSTPSSTTTATASGGTLTLALPSALSTDIAVKATLQSGSAVTGTVVIVLPSSSLSATGAGGGHMPSITNAARNAAVDGITGLINAGTPPGLLKIYAGTVPTDVNTSLGAATLLGTLTFSTTSFGASSSGTATAATITADSSADATGTATFFRITNAAGTAILQGTVGTSGADMNLNTTSIVTGATLSVTSMTITEPAT